MEEKLIEKKNGKKRGRFLNFFSSAEDNKITSGLSTISLDDNKPDLDEKYTQTIIQTQDKNTQTSEDSLSEELNNIVIDDYTKTSSLFCGVFRCFQKKKQKKNILASDAYRESYENVYGKGSYH